VSATHPPVRCDRRRAWIWRAHRRANARRHRPGRVADPQGRESPAASPHPRVPHPRVPGPRGSKIVRVGVGDRSRESGRTRSVRESAAQKKMPGQAGQMGAYVTGRMERRSGRSEPGSSHPLQSNFGAIAKTPVSALVQGTRGPFLPRGLGRGRWKLPIRLARAQFLLTSLASASCGAHGSRAIAARHYVRSVSVRACTAGPPLQCTRAAARPGNPARTSPAGPANPSRQRAIPQRPWFRGHVGCSTPSRWRGRGGLQIRRPRTHRSEYEKGDPAWRCAMTT
jgi:hypothetical protein